MEYITVEAINKNGEAVGKPINIRIERGFTSETKSQPIYTLSNGEIVNCLDPDSESEFEQIKDGYSMRFRKI